MQSEQSVPTGILHCKAFFLLLIGLMAGSAGCAPLIDDPGKSVIRVSEKDTGATVDLEGNQQLWVQLEGNRTTGFQWLLIDQTGEILETVGEAPRYETDSNPLALLGAGGTENWTFRTLKSGSGLLRFEYRRPWEKGREAINSVVFNIKVR